LLREIIIRGAHRGLLALLAYQLNHEVTHLQCQRIESMLGQLAAEVRQALDRDGRHQRGAGGCRGRWPSCPRRRPDSSAAIMSWRCWLGCRQGHLSFFADRLGGGHAAL